MSTPQKNSYLKKSTFILGATVLLCLSTQISAEIYKWTDENGNTHYSDIKPNQANSETLKIKTGTSSKETRSPQEASKELTERNQAALESKAEKLQKETQKRELEAHCEAIRSNLKTMEENSRIKITENNETRYLTPEEISEKKAKYQQDLQELCSN